ncbi:uncharacterized protein LOC105165865 [Sesamum indicum]|uniref:Uncharacterized protein LOC105165865 n=1 Tax=Sesamum indicum TaxID=4182 RepID=A0A6I9TE91_SESIN|nr:uncharacterized protein LOC105165865 [Sesamum indicum]
MEIKKLLRIMEIFLLLVFLTWASARLPFALRISAEYLRQLARVVVSPLFIFLLSNVIVLTLFFKSPGDLIFPPQTTSQNVTESHMEYFCPEFIKDAGRSSPPAAEDIVMFQDKQTVFEVTKVKVHRRSQSSETMSTSKQDYNNPCSSCGKQLRRSETERRLRVEEVAAERAEVVDELSNEEFQRAIEAFIAKQIKFHEEEKLAIVLHHG